MALLTPTELSAFLATTPNWTLVEGAITRQWTFPDFLAAIQFVNSVAASAEKANHHPDIDIRYNKVRLTLVTHDQGGITDKDIDLAKTVDIF